MKAAVLHGNEDIRYEEFPTPETLPGTVKVRVRATGICGSDVPRVLHHGAHFYPVVLGHEFSGDVVEVGEGVTLRPGRGHRLRRALAPLHEVRRLPAGQLLPVQALQLYRQPPAGQLCRVRGDARAERHPVRPPPSPTSRPPCSSPPPWPSTGCCATATRAAATWPFWAAAPLASSLCSGPRFSAARRLWPLTSTRPPGPGQAHGRRRGHQHRGRGLHGAGQGPHRRPRFRLCLRGGGQPRHHAHGL